MVCHEMLCYVNNGVINNMTWLCFIEEDEEEKEDKEEEEDEEEEKYKEEEEDEEEEKEKVKNPLGSPKS